MSLRHIAAITLVLVISGSVVRAEPAQAARRPNIVLITADNVGYHDLGCYGNESNKTPSIDRLAAQGVRCTNFYSASPTCTVSRAALLTGRYPQRNGLTHQLGREENRTGIGLRHSELLIPHFLKQRGYPTACFGKWNIGFAKGSRPTERGFDEFLGFRSGNIDYYTHVYNHEHDMFRGTEPAHLDGYSTDLFAEAACDYLRRNAKRPFFLYVPFNAVHYPNPGNKKPGEPCIWQAPDEAFQRYGYSPDTRDEKKRYQATLTALDTGVGRVVEQLDRLGLRENTLVIFCSDNGAFARNMNCASNDPLRTERVMIYEGSIRVACMVRWPGQINPGTVCHEPLIQIDFLPMILAATGTPLPKDRVIDGRDPTATLAGKAPSPHRMLFFKYHGASAVRSGQYKLLRTRANRPWELYDLAVDIGETTDLAAKKPNVVANLERQYEQWLTQVQ